MCLRPVCQMLYHLYLLISFKDFCLDLITVISCIILSTGREACLRDDVPCVMTSLAIAGLFWRKLKQIPKQKERRPVSQASGSDGFSTRICIPHSGLIQPHTSGNKSNCCKRDGCCFFVLHRKHQSCERTRQHFSSQAKTLEQIQTDIR